MATIHEQLLTTAREVSPALVNAISENGPVRLTRSARAEPFVDRLCRAVAGQQLSVAAARTIWSRLRSQCNGRPLAEHIESTALEDLRRAGLSRAKATSMHAIVKAYRAGALDALDDLDHSARSERLTSIWGGGQWTADMMGIFYFGAPDIWPEGDVTANKTLTGLTSPRRRNVRTALRFSPNRSYLALHMWRRADAVPR